MYIPAHFDEPRTEVLHGLIRARPLATLVTVSATGIQANHIPLLLIADVGPLGTLRGHVARQNRLWQDLTFGSQALAIFHGPASYISPSWYPTKKEHGKVVPTWNYVVAHAHGTLRVHDDPQWVRQLVESLTRQQEATRPNPWAVSDAPADYIEKQVRAIVGIEIGIERLEGKWKVSQNQLPANRAGAAHGLEALGGDDAVEMARAIRERADKSR